MIQDISILRRVSGFTLPEALAGLVRRLPGPVGPMTFGNLSKMASNSFLQLGLGYLLRRFHRDVEILVTQPSAGFHPNRVFDCVVRDLLTEGVCINGTTKRRRLPFAASIYVSLTPQPRSSPRSN